MCSISYPDKFHLEAAQGWLILGNALEAIAEFKQISRPYPEEPEYLQLHCRLSIRMRRWRTALRISRAQVRLLPSRPEGWINQAYCLHEMKRTREAIRTLLPAAKRFPKHDLISFNLACYCCHLRQYKAALSWVNRTLRIIERETEAAA
jgi:predicted Zn-dependent protease